MVRPSCVCFFPLATLSTALASNQTEADGGGLHRYGGGESTFLPSTVTHTRRYYSGTNQYLGRGPIGEGGTAAERQRAPPAGRFWRLSDTRR